MNEAADAFGRFEREGWQRAAQHYDNFWHGLSSLFVPHLLRSLQVSRSNRVLDVCCGPGLLSAEAASLGAETSGIDFSAAMVAQAQARYPHLGFQEGDAQELPFEPASFDVVAMNFGAPHLSKPERAFAEAARVLRPRGRFGFTTWARPEINPLAQIVDGAIAAHGDTDVGIPEGPPYFRFADMRASRTALETAGFDAASFVFETVSVDWTVPTAGFLFEAEQIAGVRTAAVLARQQPERLAAIRTAMEARVDTYRSEGGFTIPATAHVISAATSQKER
jgi:SAM-dependent methyltransferase